MKFAIDANIARSSGDVSAHPFSKKSRDLLIKIKDETNGHAIFCEKLHQEWEKHRSRFAKTWYISMVARKRIVRVVTDTRPFDERIDSLPSLSDNQKYEAKKDSHLVVLARDDKIIFSIEKNSREIFESCRDMLPEVVGLVWRSPVDEWTDCEDICSPSCNLMKYEI